MLTSPQLVERIRSANGDTQEGLARRLSVSYPTINSWERGRSEPSAKHRATLEALAAELNIVSEMKVLVIDDDPITAELVRAAAMDVDGAVTIDSALDGWTGLIKCGAMRPEILFLDIMMPGIDGLEVARRLPEIDGVGNLRIVFVTASQSPDVLARAHALGAAVLPKPLELDDLSRTMMQTLLNPTSP
ncbi:response regulator [Salinibacterium sp. SWN1162]|uniref:response regulator n=1 Tax=Salinibacterium sp. SWN1162 TaxID=2792053 RepID=UPI0018CE2B63|nr:response regulator [Salinibacterium sp. SWN1162]MBH0009617.1 response regulator [Salinibacterium sp. SWN1162]